MKGKNVVEVFCKILFGIKINMRPRSPTSMGGKWVGTGILNGPKRESCLLQIIFKK